MDLRFETAFCPIFIFKNSYLLPNVCLLEGEKHIYDSKFKLFIIFKMTFSNLSMSLFELRYFGFKADRI